MHEPSHTVRAAGHTIRYVDCGSGPPLVLLHGAPTTSYVYRHVISLLSSDFRCLAPDLPGWGKSVAVRGFTPTLPALAEAADAFIAALDLEGVTLAVMDTAGSVGFHLVQEYPVRFRGLIAADTIVFPTREHPRIHTMLRLVTTPPFRWVNRRFRLLPRVVARFGGRRRRSGPEERARYLQDFATDAHLDRIMVTFRDLNRNDAFLSGVRDGLSAMDLPVLVVAGEKDPVHQAGALRRLAECLPDSTFVEVPGEAHFPHEGDPETVAGAILGWAREVGILQPVEARP
ncbi:MAG: alpha/beta fold hydrolase [Gemmatimonadota bacterium]